MTVQSTLAFPDPATLSDLSVAELLRLAARGHIGIDKRWLQAILDRGDGAVPDLAAFGAENHEDDPVNLEEDLIALFAHFRAAEGLPFLLKVIREQPDEVEDDVIEALIRIGQPAVEPLLQLYGDIGEEEGSDVGFVLASIGVRDDRIREILLERLEFDAADGAFLLGLYGDPEAKPALEKMLAEIDPEDGELHREISFAIESLTAERKPAGPESEPDILAPYPDKAVPPVEVLSVDERLEMLASASPEYRAEAAESFRGTGELSDQIKKRLLEVARTDQDPSVRGAAWRSLVDGMEDKAIVAAMRKAALDESLSDEERLGALISLVQGDDSEDISRLIRTFYDRTETRSRAMEAMWRSLDPAFATIYPKHLDDADLEIRRNAIWGVGYSGLSAEVGRLRTFFDDEDLRADALFAYAMAMPGGVSRGRVRGMLRKIDDLSGGLTSGEAQLVKMALDQRLAMNGQEPVFAAEEEQDGAEWEEVAEAPAPLEAVPPPQPKVGRNDPCPCGSGKKYKKCHGANS